MRLPLKVFITIDTEVYPIAQDWKASGLREDIQRDIYGVTGSSELGLRYQAKLLKKYGLRAVFFVESLFASCPSVGMEPLRTMVSEIQEADHDVQLHLHPEWAPHIPGLEHISPVPIAGLKLDEQRALFRTGVSNLQAAGADAPCAYRAGDYAANFDTLKAASESGIIFDSSHNYSYREITCELAKEVGPLLQPKVVGEVCELPVAVFEDRRGHLRHAQVCAASFSELKAAMEQAYADGWGSFVIVSHSFELIRGRWGGTSASPRRIVRKRFEDLCRFLAENRERFVTSVFRDLKPSEVIGAEPSRGLKGRLDRTILRNIEQAAGRVW